MEGSGLVTRRMEGNLQLTSRMGLQVGRVQAPVTIPPSDIELHPEAMPLQEAFCCCTLLCALRCWMLGSCKPGLHND